MRDIELPLIALSRFLLAPVVVVLTLLGSLLLTGTPFDERYFVLAILAASLAGHLLADVYLDSTLNPDYAKHVGSVLVRWLGLVSFLAVVGYMAKSSTGFSRLVITTWIAVTPLFILMAESLLGRALGGVPASWGDRRALVIGAGELGKRLHEELSRDTSLRIRCLGFFDDRSPERLGDPSLQVLDRISEVASFVRANAVNTVFITVPVSSRARFQAVLKDLRDTTASIYFVPDLRAFMMVRANAVNFKGLHLIGVCESPFLGINGIVKRLTDLVLASVAFLALSALMALIACGIRLSSPGPIIFRQRRYGLDGRQILVYKFRSMHVMEEGDAVVQAAPGDSRCFAFGRFLRKSSLDELPQLFNVLLGSMSLVGPRPHAVMHNELYRNRIPGYMVRHKVRPGITGWAQVHGFRGETDTDDKMKRRIDLDLDYLRNWSLMLDFVILARTLPLVFRDPRAY